MEEIPLKSSNETDPIKENIWFKIRYLQVVILSFSLFCCYTMRACLGVALVEITSEVDSKIVNGTVVTMKRFDWTPNQQGILLSSFFWCYSISQIFGCLFAYKFGSKFTLLICILGTAFLTLVSPASIRIGGFELFLAVRALKGCFEGLFYSASIQFVSKWMPFLERTRAMSIVLSGGEFGSMVSLALSGILAFRWSWDSIFYFFGAISLVNSTLLIVLVTDTPETHPSIKRAEMEFIKIKRQKEDNTTTSLNNVPYKAILRSAPVWAIVCAIIAADYGFYLLMTELPTYLRERFDFQIDNIGIITSMPYLVSFIMMLISGQLSDYLHKRRTFSLTNIRKLVSISGLLGQTVFFTVLAMSTNFHAIIIGLILSVGLGGIAMPSLLTNLLDISPNYASFCMVMVYTFGNIGSFVAPMITGVILSHGADNWNYVFLMPSILLFAASLMIYKMSSAKIQSWDSLSRS